MFSEQLIYLVRGLQLLGLHLPEDIVGGAEGPHLGVAHLHVCWQADEPQAIAVTEQALGPQLGDGGVLLGFLMGRLYLLQIEEQDKKKKLK